MIYFIILVGMGMAFILIAFVIQKVAEVRKAAIRRKMETRADFGMLKMKVRYGVCILVDNKYVKILGSDHKDYEAAEAQLLIAAKTKENRGLEFSILPFYKAENFGKSWDEDRMN